MMPAYLVRLLPDQLWHHTSLGGGQLELISERFLDTRPSYLRVDVGHSRSGGLRPLAREVSPASVVFE